MSETGSSNLPNVFMENISKILYYTVKYAYTNPSPESLREYKRVIDVGSDFYIAKLQITHICKNLQIVDVYEAKCNACGSVIYVGSIEKALKSLRCPVCGCKQLDIKYVGKQYFKLGQACIELEDSGQTVFDIVLTYNTLNVKGGTYRAIISVTEVPSRTRFNLGYKPLIIVHKIFEEGTGKSGNIDKLQKILAEYNDPIGRLSILAELTGCEFTYGMVSERLLILALAVGAYSPEICGKNMRWWLHACILGDPETGKSHLVDILREIVPYGKCLLLSGSQLTVAGLLAGVQLGGLAYEGPLLMLDGDKEDFGVLIIEEATDISKKIFDNLKDPMERGEYYRSTALTGTIGGKCRTSIVLTGNWATRTFQGAVSLPKYIYEDDAIFTRFDIYIFTFRYTEEEADNIIRMKLEPARSPVTLADIREYIAQCRNREVHISEKKRLIQEICKWRYELVTLINSILGKELSGIRLAESLIRIGIALSKLAGVDTLEPGMIKLAGKLLYEQFKKLEHYESKSRAIISETTIKETILNVVRKRKCIEKESLIEEVKEILSKDYIVEEEDVRKALDELLERAMFSDWGPQRLIRKEENGRTLICYIQ